MKSTFWLALIFSFWACFSFGFDPFSAPETLSFTGQAKLILTGPESLAARVSAIRKAKATIDITTFFWANDPSMAVVNNELVKAANRGVKIRILSDAFWSYEFRRKDLKWLVAQGNGNIQIGLFGSAFSTHAKIPDRFQMVLNWARRLHDKIFLIDAGNNDSFLIMGGRNMNEDHLGGLSSGHPRFRDLDILVRSSNGTNSSSSAKDTPFKPVLDYFNFLSENVNTRWVNAEANQSNLDAMAEAMTSAQRLIVTNPTYDKLIQITSLPSYFKSGFIDGTFHLVHEAQNLKRTVRKMNMEDMDASTYTLGNQNSLMNSVRSYLAKASLSIDMASPSFYLTPKETNELLFWLDANPQRRLRILTNSINVTGLLWTTAITDELFLKNLEHNPLYAKVRSQIKIFQFSRLKSQSSLDNKNFKHEGLHTKYVSIDKSMTLIGSSNFDPLSRYHASESGLWISSKEFGVVMADYFNQLSQDSHEWKSIEWQQIQKQNESRVKKAKSTLDFLRWIGIDDLT